VCDGFFFFREIFRGGRNRIGIYERHS
jgi:hypothetical protein